MRDKFRLVFFKIKHVLPKIPILYYFQSYEIYYLMIFRAMIFRSMKLIIFRAKKFIISWYSDLWKLLFSELWKSLIHDIQSYDLQIYEVYYFQSYEYLFVSWILFIIPTKTKSMNSVAISKYYTNKSGNFHSWVCGVVRTQWPNTGYSNLTGHLDNQHTGWKQSIKCDASLFASKSDVPELFTGGLIGKSLTTENTSFAKNKNSTCSIIGVPNVHCSLYPIVHKNSWC